MDRQNANTKVSKWLVGSYIDKLTYYVTGWELSFVSSKFNVNAVFSEIITLNPLNWDNLIENSPLNIVETIEFKDTLTSIVLLPQ